MPSGPGEVWLGREEISVTISSQVHRYSSGQGVEAGGSETRGGQEVVNEFEKQLFSSCVFSSSVEYVDEFASRVGIELVDFRSDRTNDQNERG